MFDKLQTSITNRFNNLGHDKKEEFLNQLIMILFGGEENTEFKIQEIKDKYITQEEREKELQKLLNIDFFVEFSKIVPVNNMSESILANDIIKSNRDILLGKITNPETLNFCFDKTKEIAKLVFKTFFNIDDFSKDNLNAKIKYEVYFSKQEIADEFGIDKKTLKNWLIMVYGEDRYFGRKKLSLLEYRDILERIILANNEKIIDISDNFEIYENRIVKGIFYSKFDIIELANSNHKTIYSNLSDVNKSFYKKYAKFPYSIAKSMLQDLGTDINF
jgi:hypothetical protein